MKSSIRTTLGIKRSCAKGNTSIENNHALSPAFWLSAARGLATTRAPCAASFCNSAVRSATRVAVLGNADDPVAGSLDGLQAARLERRQRVLGGRSV